MIKLTKLNGKEIVINAELIETVEAQPDTTIGTTTGNTILVQESVETVIQKILDYKKHIGAHDRDEKRSTDSG